MSEVMLVDTKDFEKLQTVSKNLEKMVMEALSSVSTVDTLQEMPEFITDIKHKNREDEKRLMTALDYLWEFNDSLEYKRQLTIVEDWIWNHRKV